MHAILSGLTAIDLAVIAGVALVLPVLGLRWRWWLLAAAAVAVACHHPPGSPVAVAGVAPWLCASLVAAWRVAEAAGRPSRRSIDDLVLPVAALDALVAATWMLLSRAAPPPLGIAEPIVELTAVHFTYAGVGALVLARDAHVHAGPGSRAGRLAVVATASAPPVVATGFVTGFGVLQVGGALLMSVGVFLTASLQLGRALRRGDPRTVRLLLAVSGAAVWIPMVLAVAWAAGQHWTVPALSVPDMVRTHGAANAIGFVGAGLAASALARRAPRQPSAAPDRENVVG